MAPEPLFTSDDSFIDATRKLILEKNKGAPEEAEDDDGDGDDDDADGDGDDE